MSGFYNECVGLEERISGAAGASDFNAVVFNGAKDNIPENNDFFPIVGSETPHPENRYDLNVEDCGHPPGICCELQGTLESVSARQYSKELSSIHIGGFPWNSTMDAKNRTEIERTANDPLYMVALTMIEKIGPKTSRILLQHFGDAKGIFTASHQKLIRVPMVGEKIVNSIRNGQFLRAAELELEFAQKHNIKVIPWNCPRYPTKLKQISDSPMVIYVKGMLPETDVPHIAVVGTRKPTHYGKKIASEFADYFAKRGIVVVSGLAFGIDIEAHHAAMSSQGMTIAVLGHGLDLIYPREHSGKAKQIVEEGGALISEFCSGTQPEAFNFPARNRIISGLCDAVVVVEATEKGGALITAKMAFEQDRDVFAVPGNLGNPTASGCNRLIKDQIARIACGPEDVIESLEHLFKIVPEDHASRKANFDRSLLSRREQAVCEAIGQETKHFDAIEVSSGIEGAELRSVLLGLEFRKVLCQVGGNKYQLAC